MQKMDGLELRGGALKVMGNVTIRYSAYGFLFNFIHYCSPPYDAGKK